MSARLALTNLRFIQSCCATLCQYIFLLDFPMTAKALSLKMRRDWHYYAVAIGMIFILNGVNGPLGFRTEDWQNYAVGLVGWIISFWLAGFIIRRRPETEEQGAAKE